MHRSASESARIVTEVWLSNNKLQFRYSPLTPTTAFAFLKNCHRLMFSGLSCCSKCCVLGQWWRLGNLRKQSVLSKQQQQTAESGLTLKKENGWSVICSLMHWWSYVVCNLKKAVRSTCIEQENPVLGSPSLALLFQYHRKNQHLKRLRLYFFNLYLSFVW